MKVAAYKWSISKAEGARGDWKHTCIIMLSDIYKKKNSMSFITEWLEAELIAQLRATQVWPWPTLICQLPTYAGVLLTALRHIAEFRKFEFFRIKCSCTGKDNPQSLYVTIHINRLPRHKSETLNLSPIIVRAREKLPLWGILSSVE